MNLLRTRQTIKTHNAGTQGRTTITRTVKNIFEYKGQIYGEAEIQGDVWIVVERQRAEQRGFTPTEWHLVDRRDD